MKKICLILLVALVISILPISSRAEFKPSTGQLKGYMIGEYYYILDHNNPDLKNRNGFWFRRIYFTYNNELTDDIAMRLRFEMNSDDFGSDKLTAVVKDAYLSYKISGQSLMAGLISTPTWGHNVEDFWGYRSIEKTPMDLYKMGSARDFGIGLKGAFDEGKTANYFVLFGNGSSNKGESNKGKKVYGSIAFEPIKGLLLEAYGDYEDAETTNYYVYQGFAGYQGDWGRVGVQYANRHRDDDSGGEYDFQVLSIFTVIGIAKDVDIIARWDKTFGDGFENKFSGDGIAYVPFANNTKFNFIIGAISWQAAKNVWLIPNIKFTLYDDPDVGDAPQNDTYANMTLWFKF